MMTETMQALRDLQKKLYAFQFALNVIDFDAQTVAPSESYSGRGEAMQIGAVTPGRSRTHARATSMGVQLSPSAARATASTTRAWRSVR